MTTGMDDDLTRLIVTLGDAPQVSATYGEPVRQDDVPVITIRSAGAVGIHSVLGTTIVFCLAIVGWAWGYPSRP